MSHNHIIIVMDLKIYHILSRSINDITDLLNATDDTLYVFSFIPSNDFQPTDILQSCDRVGLKYLYNSFFVDPWQPQLIYFFVVYPNRFESDDIIYKLFIPSAPLEESTTSLTFQYFKGHVFVPTFVFETTFRFYLDPIGRIFIINPRKYPNTEFDAYDNIEAYGKTYIPAINSELGFRKKNDNTLATKKIGDMYAVRRDGILCFFDEKGIEYEYDGTKIYFEETTP